MGSLGCECKVSGIAFLVRNEVEENAIVAGLAWIVVNCAFPAITQSSVIVVEVFKQSDCGVECVNKLLWRSVLVRIVVVM